MKATTSISAASCGCLILSISTFLSRTGAFRTELHLDHRPIYHQHQHRQHQRRPRQTTPVVALTMAYDSLQPQNGKDEDELQQQPQEYRPISDYVGGLHGGKYVFDERIGGITALNYETSILVFDFPNNDNENDDDDAFSTRSKQKIAPPPEGVTDQPPLWASRKLGPEAYLGAARLPRFDEQGNAVVQVVNEEMSWEPFWACVETSSISLSRDAKAEHWQRAIL
jgi:hypothetical protein